jgi:hypothetical protein
MSTEREKILAKTSQIKIILYLMRRKEHNVQSRDLFVFFAALRQGENLFFTCEDVVFLAWSITQEADSVLFGCKVRKHSRFHRRENLDSHKRIFCFLTL